MTNLYDNKKVYKFFHLKIPFIESTIIKTFLGKLAKYKFIKFVIKFDYKCLKFCDER